MINFHMSDHNGNGEKVLRIITVDKSETRKYLSQATRTQLGMLDKFLRKQPPHRYTHVRDELKDMQS